MAALTKRIVLLGVGTFALLVLVAWVFVRGALGGAESYEGYFAPVYSPDGQYVYFVERSTSGSVKVTYPGDLFFSAPKFDVFVVNDNFSLKRLHIKSSKVEELIRLPPSPIEGRRYEAIGSAFQSPDARLRFKKGGQLEFNVCVKAQLSGHKEYSSFGVWTEARHAAETSPSWKETYCQISGYDEWPLFGDWELMEVRGGSHLFPTAIVAYNNVTSGVKVLLKNKEYERVYPDGVPLQQIVANSRRSRMEREQTVTRTHAELMQKYKAMGTGENQAGLRTIKDMQRLGYYPKPTTIVARRLGREEAARVEKDALFSIAKGEMESGIFQDIEKAIATPGEEIEKDSEYFTHRDYSTSARLNAFLKTGKTQFYVRYLGNTFELTIRKPDNSKFYQ